jgi:hypothetical protein
LTKFTKAIEDTRPGKQSTASRQNVSKPKQDTNKSNKDEQKRTRIVFDPSLLIPPSNMLLRTLVDNHTVLLTRKMADMLFSQKEPPANLQNLLRFWGEKPEAVPLSIAWLRKEKTNIKDFDRLKEFREQKLLVPLRRYLIDNDSNLQLISDDIIQFIADEICLALMDKIPTPILCAETSSWKNSGDIQEDWSACKRRSY